MSVFLWGLHLEIVWKYGLGMTVRLSGFFSLWSDLHTDKLQGGKGCP